MHKYNVLLKKHKYVIWKKPLKSNHIIKNFIKKLFKNEGYEILYVVAIDNNLIPVGYISFDGWFDKCEFDTRKILAFLVCIGTPYALLIHNHVNGEPIPTKEDWNVTNYFKIILSFIDMCLIDHIIVGTKEITYLSKTKQWKGEKK